MWGLSDALFTNAGIRVTNITPRRLRTFAATAFIIRVTFKIFMERLYIAGDEAKNFERAWLYVETQRTARLGKF